MMIETIYLGFARMVAENSLHLAEPRKELDYCIKRIDDALQLSSHERRCMIEICLNHINRVRYNDNER